MSTVTPRRGLVSLESESKRLAVAGGTIVLLGLLAITLPLATGITLAVILGALLVLSGVVHASHAITAGEWTGRLWQATLAVVSVGAGIAVLANPVVGLLTLTLLAIAYLFVDGVVELATSLRMGSDTGRGWIAASGGLSLLLAALLWAGFPVNAIWVIGVLVGVSLLVTGFSMVAVAYGSRELEAAVSPPSADVEST